MPSGVYTVYSTSGIYELCISTLFIVKKSGYRPNSYPAFDNSVVIMRKCLLIVQGEFLSKYWNQLGKYSHPRTNCSGLLNCWKCFHLLYSQNRFIFNRIALPACLQRTLYSTCNFKVISTKHSREEALCTFSKCQDGFLKWFYAVL